MKPSLCLCRFLFVTSLLLSLWGCGASQYATPRTTPAKQFSHSLAAEALVNVDVRDPDTIPLMRYELRYGLASRVDMGVRLGPTLGLNFKWNFLRSAGVDMAITPAVDLTSYSVGYMGYTGLRVAAPISIGFNVVKTTTIYLHGSPVYYNIQEAEGEYCYSDECTIPRNHILPEGGIGMQFRVGSFVALNPEISLVFFENAPFAQIGLGVVLGALPNYEAEE